jgi:hypothetical protein
MAWQGVEYASVRDGGALVVLGLGPIGDMAARVARHRGYRVIGVDLVPERLTRVDALGIEVLDLTRQDDLAGVIREMTDGRGPDAVLDAVGIEAHGSSMVGLAHKLVGLLPGKVAQPVMQNAGVSKLAALYSAIEIMPLLSDEDPLGVETFATHHLPLADAPAAHEHFQKKEEGMVKVVFSP